MRLSILTFLGWCLATLCVAQTPETPVKPIGNSTDARTLKELQRKFRTLESAVHGASRHEWKLVRTWPGYDEDQVRTWVHARGEAMRAQQAARQTAPPPSDACDCWIEPDDSYTTISTFDWDFVGGAGVNVDCSFGPISLPWTFAFFDQFYTNFYINSKGSISFGDYIIDWTPEEFPNTVEQVAQIALFWADTDLRSSGEIKYKITPEAVYVNFIDVGYYNNHGDQVNSYQVIFTPTTASGVLSPGFNAQLCYRNLGWAHGDVGGSLGFNGNNPATVGADAAPTTGAHIQYGRFNLPGATYNGPYGGAPSQQDGIAWLEGKSFNMNVVSSVGNLPPLPLASSTCDTLFLCQGQTLDVNLGFLSPEPDQIVGISSSAASGWTYTTTSGPYAYLEGVFLAHPDNVGVHVLHTVATDSYSPEASSEINLIVKVLPEELPEIVLDGALGLCDGGETELSIDASGFDAVLWSNGATGASSLYTSGGDAYVIGQLGQCEQRLDFEIDQPLNVLPDLTLEPAAVCPGETTVATVDPSETAGYTSYTWVADWNGEGGDIVSGQTTSAAELTAGTFALQVTDTSGCFGQRVFSVASQLSFIPETGPLLYCNGIPEQIVFDGGFSDPSEGNLTLYLQSTQPGGWNGSYLYITVSGLGGVTEAIATSNGAFSQFNIPIAAGDQIEIEFVLSNVTNPDFLAVSMYNCGNQPSSLTTFNDPQPGILYSGPAGCTSSPVAGTWEVVSGPPGWSFSTTTEWNTVFVPGGPGITEVCFTDFVCETASCYSVQISDPENPVLECAGCLDPQACNYGVVDPENPYAPCLYPDATILWNDEAIAEVVPICPEQGISLEGSSMGYVDAEGNSHPASGWHWAIGNDVFSEGSTLEVISPPTGVLPIVLTVSAESLGTGACTATTAVTFVAQEESGPQILASDTVCAGTPFIASILNEAAENPTLATYPDGFFLPDNQSVCFEPELTIGSAFPNATITDAANQIEAIRVNMEHSYLGDLVITLECPTGESLQLQTQGGGGTFLGEPIDIDAAPLDQGVGYDYGWGPGATQGTMAENAGGTLLPGIYEAVSDWSALNGCPVSGTWRLEVCDLLGSDNGFIWNWGVEWSSPFFSQAFPSTPLEGTCTGVTWTVPEGWTIDDADGCAVQITPQGTEGGWIAVSWVDELSSCVSTDSLWITPEEVESISLPTGLVFCDVPLEFGVLLDGLPVSGSWSIAWEPEGYVEPLGSGLWSFTGSATSLSLTATLATDFGGTCGAEGSIEIAVCSTPGCTDEDACNYNPEADYDDGSCCLASQIDLNCPTVVYANSSWTCTLDMFPGWDAFEDALPDGFSCVWTCTGGTATPQGNGGSCVISCGGPGILVVCVTILSPGCDGIELCIEVDIVGQGGGITLGCTDIAACNYDPSSNLDNGTCVVLTPCTISGPYITAALGACTYTAQSNGGVCTWSIEGGWIVCGQGTPTVQVVWFDATGTLCFQENLTTWGDCPGPESCLIVESTSQHVAYVDAPAPLQLYPNPARGSVRVNLPSGGPSHLGLYTLDGRLVQSQTLPAGPARTWDWELRGSAAGVYLVRLDSGNAFQLGKLVINSD